jgi:ethanolamine utilization protein EutQ (cupin superfamily)
MKHGFASLTRLAVAIFLCVAASAVREAVAQSPPTISINDASASEGGGNVVFTVTQSAVSATDTTFEYSTADGSAVAPDDYTAASSAPGVIPAGSTTAMISVPISNDTIHESDETFTVTLSNPTNATIATGTGTGTIQDNDAVPSFAISDVTQNETGSGEAAFTFTVTKSGDTALSSSVEFTTQDDTATVADNDYVANTGILTFAAGDTTKTITVQVKGDAINEATETFTVHLSNPSGATISDADGTGTITNDDAQPTFTVANTTQNEGAGSATVTVTKNGATAFTTTVHYATSDGSATAPADYAATAGDLTFAPGDSSMTFTVAITNDTVFEGDENFNVTLSAPSNATLGTPSSATVTITENDPAPVLQFSSGTYNVGEAGGTATITVTKIGSTAVNATVHYATSDGTATAPGDYTSTSGDLTFAPGNSSMTFTVPITNDTVFEGNENFGVTLSAPTNATLGTPSSATVTIADNDSAPVFQFSSATYNVGEADGTVTITVTKTGPTAVNATVHYATSDGTATAPADYTSTAGDLTFAPADTSTTFTVPISNDTVFEGNESFSVTLSAPTNSILGANNPATVTITENDPAPTVQFSAANYNVNEGAGLVTLTVTKTGSTVLTTTVHYATSDGTAIAPDDYASTAGDITFAANETSKDFTVPIVNDSVFEATENFSVTLTQPGNSTRGTPSTATVIIADNDQQPTVQFSPATYSTGEAAGSVTLTVTKTGATALNATVHFATSDGTAVAPGDYTAAAGDLTFAPNETSKEITVSTVNDAVIENSETFTVTLTAPSGATLGTSPSATVTIVDNDAPPQVQWNSATYSADENSGNAVLVIRRTGIDSGTMVVHYSTSDGTAKAGSDYIATSGDVTFISGAPPEQIVNVPLINDSLPESTENFTVILSAPSGGTIGTPSTATVSITDTDTPPSPTPTPTPSPTPTAPQALNLSTRLKVETGDHAMIAGFIITGNGFKQVVLRGLGPTLAPFDIPDFLPDPVLELRRSNGSLIIRNNDWKDNQRGQIEGTPFEPGDDHESVIVATLQPGRYTAILTEKNDMTGIGLVEVYDTDPPSFLQLANISTRGFVRAEDKVMIGGFTLGGNSNNARIVVRGLGPSLKKFFLDDLLADPTLELHNANGTPAIVNDNWEDDPVSAAGLRANNFAPEDPHEAAIFVALPSGPYTAVLAGKEGSIGLGLVEIYNLQ